MDIAVTPTLPFVISVMPFEKQLIAEAIVVHGSALEFPKRPCTDTEELSLISKLFNRWERKKASKIAFEGLADDILDLVGESEGNMQQAISLQMRENVYRSLFVSLGTPMEMNRCYSQIAKSRNPWIKHAILTTPDVVEFLQLISFSIDEDDLAAWGGLVAMLMKLPKEMERWTSKVASTFGFDIWKVVRMFSIQDTCPESGLALLEFWESPTQRHLAEILSSEYRQIRIGKSKVI